jgi:hypothetical protein
MGVKIDENVTVIDGEGNVSTLLMNWFGRYTDVASMDMSEGSLGDFISNAQEPTDGDLPFLDAFEELPPSSGGNFDRSMSLRDAFEEVDLADDACQQSYSLSELLAQNSFRGVAESDGGSSLMKVARGGDQGAGGITNVALGATSAAWVPAVFNRIRNMIDGDDDDTHPPRPDLASEQAEAAQMAAQESSRNLGAAAFMPKTPQ